MTLRAPRRLAQALGLLLAAALLGGCATLASMLPLPASTPATAASGAAAYRLDVAAPDEVRALLTTYLDLARFQSATGEDGVTPSELARLVAAAPAQARGLLETEGYFSAEVTVHSEGGMPPLLRVQVALGPRTLVSAFALRTQGPLHDAATAGDAAARDTQQALEQAWPLKPNAAWRQGAWADAKNETLARLRAEGYPAATLAGSQAQIDAPTQRAQLEVVLESGPLFRLGALRIEGLQRQDAVSVQRLAGFDPGTPYSEKRLFDFQERLRKVGLFESVSVEVEPDPAQAAGAPVWVRLRELPLQQATVGAGFSANTGARVSLEHLHRRVFGLPWSAKSKIEFGRDLRSIETEFTSHPLDGNYRNLLAASVERLTTTAEVRTSGRLRAGREQDTPRIERLYYAELTRSELTTLVTGTTAIGDAASLNYQWIFRELDSVVLPTDGVTASALVSGGYARSNDADNGPFGRALARLTLYKPLGSHWYGLARVEAGQVFAADRVGLPDTLLFRAGGDDSVRGYAYRSLGPVKQGAVTSARVLLTASAEVAQPISPRLPSVWWAAFVDAGNAAGRWNELKPAVGYGLGLRWRSPVGPLRVDLAYGQDVAKFRLHLSVGIAF